MLATGRWLGVSHASVVVVVVVDVVGFVPPASHEPPLSLQFVGAANVPL